MGCNLDNLIIRKAYVSDAKNIIDYVNKIGGESDFLTFGENEFKVSEENEESYLESILKSDNSLFIIAEFDGKIVGNLNFSGGGRTRIKHTGEFGVSVLKEYWGNGIGRLLIEYLIDWAKENNVIKKINLRVREDNIKGIELYKKLGFIEEGIISRDFIVAGKFYSSICMGLEIE